MKNPIRSLLRFILKPIVEEVAAPLVKEVVVPIAVPILKEAAEKLNGAEVTIDKNGSASLKFKKELS